MSSEIEILRSEIVICELHANLLQKALNHLKPITPIATQKLEQLTDEELGFLELLTSRFAKLQDTIGQKIFPLILASLQEDIKNTSFLDRLHKLEKLGILESAVYWVHLREIRNSIANDYPENPELMVTNINKVIVNANSLLDYWHNNLKVFIDRKIDMKGV
jgi:hypothetical protein